MVAVYHFNVLELVACVFDLWVSLGLDVRHIAPVVHIRWSLTGFGNEAIDTCAVDGCRQVVDAAFGRWMPSEIY